MRAALVGDVDGAVLRAAGWRVRGSLQPLPWDDRADVPGYPELDDLLEDDQLTAVAVDGADPLVARHLPVLLARPLDVLLTSPAPLDEDLLLRALDVEEPGELVVAFLQRWEPWARTAAAALALLDTTVLQATVRGWPRGLGAAAELVDLARAWCGEVVAVTASPAPLPADELGPGLPVAWSLLHASGATTLVSHEGASPAVRLSTARARLEAGPLGARWVGGAEIPLLPGIACVMDVVGPPGTPTGLLGCALELTHERMVSAGLADLLSASRVLSALRASAREERSVTLA